MRFSHLSAVALGLLSSTLTVCAVPLGDSLVVRERSTIPRGLTYPHIDAHAKEPEESKRAGLTESLGVYLYGDERRRRRTMRRENVQWKLCTGADWCAIDRKDTRFRGQGAVFGALYGTLA
ncbi:hypothetical protein BT96DRAFT_976678 [Gymnopus androsaceus JB14]|uniref:Uncharacterized protein n=1 Tax=Gymnopus androsaceus JB14 TaxID=1447944 RepID=A0A6A4HHJ4_9AGAR|nr:hypothetical protein BT96DRAFT_976678 [Gymnopus androsaceus JB14]